MFEVGGFAVRSGGSYFTHQQSHITLPSTMNSAEVNLTLEPAAETPRPLVLTPGEDLRGYLLAHLGRAVLFLMTFTSVLAVLLILLFVIVRSFSFLSGYSIAEFLANRD